MKIIVLIKQVPDPKEHVELRPDGTIAREKAKPVMNPYDKHALEAALQIKDKIGAEIIAISMGPMQAIEVLREAIAMGADNGILLCDERLAGSDTLATSYALSLAIKKIGDFDLIFCGMETTDGNTGQVGPEIAERLGIPQITYVEKIEIKRDKIEAKRLIEGGYERIEAPLPALLTITNTANEPRYPSIIGIMNAMKKVIPIWNIVDIGAEESKVGLKGSPTKIKKIEIPSLKRKGCIFNKDEDVDAIVKKFLDKLKQDGVILK